MKNIFIQTYNLIRQDRLYSIINIVGTAVTIAFVMVVIMMYDFRISDIAPEKDRSRYLYTDMATTYIKTDHTDVSETGLGRKAFNLLTDNIDGIEEVTWYSKTSKSLCGLPNSNKTFSYFVRPVSSNWFSFFEYKFISGRFFTQEEYDSKRWVCVVTRKLAMFLYGTTDVVGKDFNINFFPARIVGVIDDVNSIFQTAYADAFIPFSTQNEDNQMSRRDGLAGMYFGVLKFKDGADREKVKEEIYRREKVVNNLGSKYELKINRLFGHIDYTFFRGKDINASLVYSALILMLLIVPAINISGMTHAQMQKRESEIAVRKAYGASNVSLMTKLFSENLISTLIGGIFGYIISCIIICFCRAWLLGSGEVDISGITFGDGILLRPMLFLAIFVVCIVFNLLSVLLPAWLLMKRDIASTLKGE